MVDRLCCVVLAVSLVACGKSEPVVSLREDKTSNNKPETRTVNLPARPFSIADGLLTDPILQLPKAHSVNVVWYTSFAGSEQTLLLGSEKRVVAAKSTRMSRMLEDGDSEIPEAVANQLREATAAGVRERTIFRHVALAEGLKPGERVPYQVESVDETGQRFRSDVFTLQPLPATGQAVSILLTSDQQNQPMSAANYQKVEETVGQLDAILFAGDFVDHPNRASEWFDRANANRPAFYPAMQGHLDQLGARTFKGGALLQQAALFGSLGNHDISGRWRPEANTIGAMFNDPQPEWYAKFSHSDAVSVRDHSFESITYDEMWDHPDNGPQGERYWSYQYGDTFIISLHVNRIWRMWGDNRKGKLGEAPESLADPDQWGFGDHVFDPFGPSSPQFLWLQKTLRSSAFQQSKYKIVMAHQTIFGLGENALPVLAAPQAVFTLEGEEQPLTLTHPISQEAWTARVKPVLTSVRSITYNYPKEKDAWKQAVEPLLLEAGVQLVLCGHSHLWNRANVGSLNYLETSNVGNSFGARFNDSGEGKTWPPSKRPGGDPLGRTLVTPTHFNPMQAWEGYAQPLPFVSSNEITVFSIFTTGDGLIKSYAFDTTKPNSETILFDEFRLESP